MAALSFMRLSNGRRACELDGGVNMTFARKLELGCALVIGILEIALISLGMKDAIEVWKDSNRVSEIYLSILAVILGYLFPCILVLLGSYFHSIQRQRRGMGFLLMGGLVISCVFIMSLYVLAVIGYNTLFSQVNVALIVMAIFTVIVSFVVERQNKKALSSS
jgi:hypothetical protein